MGIRLEIGGSKIFDIGYRYFLTELALNAGVERFRAVNLRKEKKLVVFADGAIEALEGFNLLAKETFPEDAEVDEVLAEDYIGYVPKIEPFLLLFNVSQSRKFIKIGDRMSQSQEEYIEISVQNLQETRNISSKLEEMRLEIKDVGTEIAKDSNSKFNYVAKQSKDMKELKEELKQIKNAL